ncbi:nitrogenase-stabilizing/protective protein NifW [Vibrio sp. MA40-2]|uniref:nitrogenase-stabilizing/protective protein NifW n=1 Tax=Vibrio sp. MA40-2 TaxID=3391828 RepID=UPI0039A4D019
MNNTTSETFSSLESAEDFLDYFDIPYEPELVQRKRIQLLRLFQHVLNTYPTPWQNKDYTKALNIAYCQIQSGNELAFSTSGCESCSDCDD